LARPGRSTTGCGEAGQEPVTEVLRITQDKQRGAQRLGPVAELGRPAIVRILTGQQSMDVYKAIKPEAQGAAELAVDLLKGTKPTTVGGLSLTSTTTGGNQVPSVLLTPVAVTKATVKDTVIKDGFYPATDVCAGAAASACTQLGIS